MALIILCGQKDCGKSYFLNKLKSEHNVNVFDLDSKMLENSNEQTIRQLYAKLGEKKFREYEQKIFEILMQKLDGSNAVVALGGGALGVLDSAAKHGKTVYLFQKEDVLFERMRKEGLPAFVKDRQSFCTLFENRDKIYSQKCSKIIDLSKTGEDEVCQTLLEMYLN